jgi:integrase/recombinase XerD
MNLEVGYLRCMGKGRRERICPVGRVAIQAVEKYLKVLRPALLTSDSGRARRLSGYGHLRSLLK